MFFIPTFLRSSFPVYALGQSSLTTFLLSSALCFLVSSYTIDNSCSNYKGRNIGGDIQQAINEVREMASNAFAASFTVDDRYNRLLLTLFGADRRRHRIVAQYFERASNLGYTDDFVVVCDDLEAVWEPIDSVNPQPNPMGVWVDHRYGWASNFEQFTPCDPARKFNTPITNLLGYTMSGRVIYLCPYLLDKPLGRSLAPYKDQELFGQSIDSYVSLPVVLFHELLHTHIFQLGYASVRVYPPNHAFLDPNINLFDPQYLSSLPIKEAIGFPLCRKLAIDSPDLAVQNSYSVAVCALALYLSKNDWAVYLREGVGSPPS